MTAIDQWHAYVRAPDPKALHDLLDENVIFDSPVVHSPQHGRAITHAYLGAAAAVLGGPDFRYVGEWRNATGAVLEFVTTIDDITINGVDIIHMSDDSARITRFKVMVRPLKAVNLVHRLMGEALSRSATRSA